MAGIPDDVTFPDTQPANVPDDVKFPDQVPPEGPMPGTFRALGQGLAAGVGEAGQSVQAIEGQQPTPQQETSPAAQPLEWGDVPSLNFMPKLAYQLGKGAPTLAAGIAGGVAGAATPIPGGGLAGGALGAAAGSAFQEIGPYFAQELKKSPSDPDGAWTRALHEAEVSGAFSGAAWSLFPVRLFQGPLKQIAFQAFGVQPAVNVAEQATQNIVGGQPVTENLGGAYAQGALGSVIPAAGHAIMRGPGTKPTLDPNAGFKPQFTGNTIDPVATHTQGLAPSYKEIDMTAPPQQPQANPGFIGSVAKKLTGIWQRNFQPESINDASLQAQGPIRQYFSTLASRTDSTLAAHEAAHFAGERLVANYGKDAAIDFMSYAAGEPVAPTYVPPPEMAQHLPVFKQLMKWVLQEDDKVGFDYGDKGDDYFPRQFIARDQQKANQVFMRATAGRGQPGFQKPRTLDLLRDGTGQRLELVTYNPADLIVNRLMASAEGRARMELLGHLNDGGMAQPLDSEGAKSRAQYEGWNLIKDPTGRQWGIHPDIQQIWDRAMVDRGLWSDPGTVGTLFKKWMDLKNTYVPLKLMASGFHPLHVAHINFVNGMAQGWTELTSGRPVKAVNAFAKGVYGMVANAIPGVPTQAKFAREAWLQPEWSRTPEQAAVVKLMQEAGFSPQLGEELRTADSRAWRDHWINSEYAQAILPAVKNAVVNVLQKPVFEHWIPSLKTAAFLDAAKSLSERRPDIFQDDNLRRAATGAIAKSIDNRYGEMFYKTLTWNKIMRDAGIGTFLSMGWNLGFMREGVGGILEPFMRDAIMTPTQEAIYAAKNKFTYSLLYAGTAMMLGGLMTRMMTGKDPEEILDYVFPRTGTTNPDGTPHRLSTMFYTREAPMLVKHAEEQNSVIGGISQMLYNKTLIEPFKEMYTNRDYYGFEIMNPDSPWYQQAYQMGKFIMSDMFNPITVTGAKRALQAQGMWDENDSLAVKMQKILTTHEGQLSLAGFGPAPSYVSRSDTLNRLNYLFQHYVAPELRPQMERDIMQQRHDARMQLAVAKQNKDQAGIQEATRKLKELMTPTKEFTPDKYMFQKLPFSEQINFLQGLSKEDFKYYFPWANKQARADENIKALWKRYYQ